VPDSRLAVNIVRGNTTVLEVMRSGRIEWTRSDGVRRLARIDAARVEQVVQELRTGELSGGKWVGERYTGPDAEATRIVVRDGDETIIDVASWHENFESDPRLAATVTGIIPLAGKSREEVLAAQPAGYQEFRRRWQRVIALLRSLIPQDGRP
jgi:hypothetical protein